MKRGHSTIVLDSSNGDGCKGKLCSYIAYIKGCDLAIRAGTGTNAGHSLYYPDKDGKLTIFKTNQLPLAGILPEKNMPMSNTILAVGSGVMFDPIKTEAEIEAYGLYGRVWVDSLCSIITDEHKKREAEGENYSESHTGSTKSGTGEARVDRVRRIGKLVKDLDMDSYRFNHCNVSKLVNTMYDAGKKIIVEGTQGHDLSLYCSNQYPVVTSDNCTTTAFADDVGLSWNRINDVCMCIKSAPTMVAQNCGTLKGEISREEIERLGIVEKGVTTGRLRRKSLEIDFDLLEEAVMINQPTYFALTFCDHVDRNINRDRLSTIETFDDLQENGFPKTYYNILQLRNRFPNIPVKYIEFGKNFFDIIELKD